MFKPNSRNYTAKNHIYIYIYNAYWLSQIQPLDVYFQEHAHKAACVRISPFLLHITRTQFSSIFYETVAILIQWIIRSGLHDWFSLRRHCPKWHGFILELIWSAWPRQFHGAALWILSSTIPKIWISSSRLRHDCLSLQPAICVDADGVTFDTTQINPGMGTAYCDWHFLWIWNGSRPWSRHVLGYKGLFDAQHTTAVSPRYKKHYDVMTWTRFPFPIRIHGD